MRRLVLVVGAVLGLSELAPARAQFCVGPLGRPGCGGGYSYSYRGGYGFALGGPRFGVGGFSGGFVARSAYFAPPLVPFGHFGHFGALPLGFAPLGYGGYGYGPGFGGYGPPPGFGANLDPDGIPVAGAEPPDPRPNPLPPRGDFLVIAPKKATVPEVTRVATPAAARPPGPVIAFDPFARPALVNAERVEADPKKEAARLVKLGLASFAAADYGRAAEHFARASAADPDDARTYFLHAQAKFAAGQYAEAVARIREGLDRDPKWPAAAFDPAGPYGGRPDRFAAHLAELKKAVADNPGRATLEFLLGYQLWFAGEKAEAEKLFRAAEKRLAAPGPIALFK
jgi:hypothetical protein